MGRHIAFLRAINVGKRRVKMVDLKACFEGLGFEGIETFIASGNVIFDTKDGDIAALTARIEAHLLATLGYEVDTFLRTPAQVVEASRWLPEDGMDYDPEQDVICVAFLGAEPDIEAVTRLMSKRSELDAFRVQGREVYWVCKSRRDSKFSNAKLEKALKMPGTIRNITTVRKLARKYPG